MFYRIKRIKTAILRLFMGDWHFFLYDERIHKRNIIRQHYNKASSNLINEKTIIYMANGFCDHAGLSDRFKGMTALFEFCKNQRIDFRIFHTHPFNITDYIEPNLYNWRIDETMICYNKSHVSVNYFMLHPLVNKYIESGEIIMLEHEWLKKTAINTSKSQLHFYTNMIPESDKIFSSCFNELFKPSKKLNEELNHHRQAIGGKYISISFRFVQLLGDFIDCEGEILPVEQQQILIQKSINAIRMIKKQNPLTEHVLVTADSINFLYAAKKIPFVYVVDGKVGHINFENSDEVNMKTFLDFFMVSGAQKVYLAKSGKMYNSDFARRAALINNKPFELFLY